jgi:ankyrin repeat protein
VVQVLVDAGADVNGRQADGITPLMSAAWNNQLGFVRKLLALGADPNARLESGLTALMLATSCGYGEVVDVLNPVTEVQRDPSPGSLWAAASAGDLAQVDRALAAGVSPNLLAGQDLNPLLAAAMNKHYDVAARLLAAGANPNFSTKYNGLTPLWFTRTHQNEPLAKLLIEAGASDGNRHRKKSRSN